MLEFAPIMPALCLMLFSTYYAQNYAGTIGAGLLLPHLLLWANCFLPACLYVHHSCVEKEFYKILLVATFIPNADFKISKVFKRVQN